MTRDHEERGEEPASGAGEGSLALNILKLLFLIAVLAGFWYWFDRWLNSK